MMLPTGYDQVLYRGLPFAQTHPERLAAISILFGDDPPPVSQCGVLELGCGDGGNLLPMAFHLPNSTFLGIDLARKPIDMASEAARELGLENIAFEQADILDFAPERGMFDYIIAHGVYSWVPEHVRDKVLAICSANLNPNGVAYVSFNALPGCYMRLMLRDMMLYHIGEESDPEARLARGRELLQFVMQSADIPDSSVPAMKLEARMLLEQPGHVLFHDELAPAYFALHFTDFAAHAAQHGLQYVGEANFFVMEAHGVSGDTRAELDAFSRGRRLAREQYLDFLRCRKFRQTLLCHAAAALSDAALPERLRQLYISSPAVPSSDNPDIRGDSVEEFTAFQSNKLKTSHPSAKAVLVALSNAWPEAMAFDALARCASEIAGAPVPPDVLSGIVFAALKGGLVEVHAMPTPCVARPGPRPAANAIARWQARHAMDLTTGRHTSVNAPGALERRVIELLDGTRTVDEIAHDIDGMLDPRPPEAEIRSQLNANLTKLARFGLLVQ